MLAAACGHASHLGDVMWAFLSRKGEPPIALKVTPLF
jgi:hypothetical protein